MTERKEGLFCRRARKKVVKIKVNAERFDAKGKRARVVSLEDGVVG